MAFHDYECNKCGYIEEYNTGFSVSKTLYPPKDLKCPKCKKGKMIKQFSVSGQSFKIH